MDLVAGIEALQPREQGDVLDDPKVVLDRERGQVVLLYRPTTHRAICDVCDYKGNVYRTKAIESNTTKLPIDDLNKGIYQIFIMDAGKMLRQPFQL